MRAGERIVCMFPRIFRRCAARRFAGLAGSVLILFLASPAQAAPLKQSMAAAAQTIVINADNDLGETTLKHGFLHGITYEQGRNYSRTTALISDLKPGSWRLSNHRNRVYDFVVGASRLPQTVGTQIVFNVQDVFHVRHGYNIKVNTACPMKRKGCYSTYDQFEKAWLEVVDATMKAIIQKEIVVHYFDVYSEPTTGHTKLDGLTPRQLADVFKGTHDTIRRYRPGAKIVGMSMVAYGKHLKAFLDFVATNDIRLDALSWHEFKAPEVLPEHVNEIREYFKTHPRLCRPACPEIHINEYMSDTQHLVPGYAVGWLYYLEKARVNHANRACWDVPNGGSTCWTGVNGMLLPDNATPQPLYWVYKAYADMRSSRVATQSSAPRLVAIASKDESRRELRILAGRFGQKGAHGQVAIEVRGVRHVGTSVAAEMIRIPDTGNAQRALPALPAPSSQVVPVRDNSLLLTIPDFRDGDAFVIVLRPARGKVSIN
jgi:xylan 1,4-beta-xylosidase